MSKGITVRLHHTPRGLRIGVYHAGRIIGMVQADGIDFIPGYKVKVNPYPGVRSDHTWFNLLKEDE